MQTQITKFIFSFLLIFIAQLTFAQSHSCGTKDHKSFQSAKEKYPNRFKQFIKEFKNNPQRNNNNGSCINYVPIKAHIIRTSAGNGGLDPDDLQEAIDTMNVRYAAACMAYYICGSINYIDDDTYYDFETNEESALTTANNVADLVNIYFANTVTSSSSGSSFCGYAYYPGGPDVILMKNSCTTNGSTLAHELGHFFGLPHTHSGGDELVNGSNCTTAGDDFCDTPADPQLSSSTVTSSCQYIGTAVDANGDTYVPDPTNIMSYSRKACRDFFSNEQLAEMSFNFLNVRNYWDCSYFDVDFTANVTQACDAPLTVSFTEQATGETSYKWDFDNDGNIDATGANPSHTYTATGNYCVRLIVFKGTDSLAKVKTDYIQIGAETFPFNSTMENFTVSYNAIGFDDGWTASPSSTNSVYRWNTNDGTTLSSNTGPEVDHTTGTSTGIYAYAEASQGGVGDMAELISPCLDVPATASNPNVTFWYHMYGGNVGTLHIDLHDGTNWINDFAPAIVGEQQTSSAAAWLENSFSVSSYVGSAIQIRFRAERGGSWNGDIAIDDFEILELVSLPVDLTKFEGKENTRGEHVLNWETASEENSAYFLLEHSADGNRFEVLEKIISKGNTSFISKYEAVHSRPAAPHNYYRLKMVDVDETFEYSNTLYLPYERPGASLSIFPNPSNGQYQLERTAGQSQWELQIFNTVGQLIKTDQWQENELDYQLNIQNFSNGVYWIQVLNEGEVIRMERLVKF